MSKPIHGFHRRVNIPCAGERIALFTPNPVNELPRAQGIESATTATSRETPASGRLT